LGSSTTLEGKRTSNFSSSMHARTHALLSVLCFALVATSASAKSVDVTLQADFDIHVGKRDDTWVVVFNQGPLSNDAALQWLAAASSVKDLVRFGTVNCNEIDEDSAYAGAPCARAAKSGKEKVLGYTFTDKGEREVSTETYTGVFDAMPITRWIRPFVPRLQVQLTSVRMEQLGEFLKRPRIVKALMFPKDEYSTLVTGLALRFRKHMLVGQVKPTDGTMRKAFAVASTDSMVVVDAKAKRHMYKGRFERASMEEFLKKFTSDVSDANDDVRDSLKKENFGSSGKYFDAENTFPAHFDPWRVLGLPRSTSIPAAETLKSTYKAVAKKWHPDKCQTSKSECERRMSETALAKHVLSDGRRLQQWEAWRQDEAENRKYGRSDL